MVDLVCFGGRHCWLGFLRRESRFGFRGGWKSVLRRGGGRVLLVGGASEYVC